MIRAPERRDDGGFLSGVPVVGDVASALGEGAGFVLGQQARTGEVAARAPAAARSLVTGEDPEELGGVSAVDAALLIGGGGFTGGAIRAGVQAGARVAGRIAARRGAREAGEEVGRISAVGAARTLSGARGGAPIARGTARVPARQPRPSPARQAGRVAGAAGRGALRAASFPIRRPVRATQATFAAQAPAAVTGGPQEFQEVLEGTGVAANVLSDIGETVSDLPGPQIGLNLIRDVLELPAIIPPAVYLPLAAGVEAVASGGEDTEDLDRLIQGYAENGLLPAVFRGDVEQVKRAITEHPLFSALEARGLQAGVGRAAGAAARSRVSPQRLQGFASQERPALVAVPGTRPGEVPPGARPVRRPEGGPVRRLRTGSPDLFERGAQRLIDRTRAPVEGGRLARSRRARARIQQEQIDTRFTGGVGGIQAARGTQQSGAEIARRRRPVEAVREAGPEVDRLRGRAAEARRRAERTTSEMFRNQLQNQAAVFERQAQRVLEEATGRAAEIGLRRRPGDLSPGVRSRARVGRRISEADQRASNLMAQGIITPTANRTQFLADIDNAIAGLQRTNAELRANQASAENALPRADFRNRVGQNQEMQQVLRTVRKDANPEIALASTRLQVQGTPETPGLRAGAEGLEQRGVLAPEQARQARAIPFARAQMGAEFRATAPGRQPQLVTQEGRPLNFERVEQAIVQRGGSPDDVGFISQAPDALGARNFWRNFIASRASLLHRRARTGEATVQGLVDTSFDTFVQQRVGQATTATMIDVFDNMIGDLAIGGFRFKSAKAFDRFNRPETLRAAGLPEGIDLVRVRIVPGRARAGERRAAQQTFDERAAAGFQETGQPGAASFGEELAAAALREGPGDYVALPQTMWNRVQEHMKSASTAEKIANVAKTGFTTVVLPVSPNWYLGNFIDISMRSILAGALPGGRNARLGKFILDRVERLDPRVAQQLRAEITPGTLFGTLDKTRMHADARRFTDTWVEPIARGLQEVGRAPGARSMKNLWVSVRNAGFRFEEIALERQAQFRVLGKEARNEVKRQQRQVHRSQRDFDAAIEDFAKGLLKTENQVKAARSVEQTLGQWTRNSPGTRRFLASYSPFGMWARASTRFALVTLPARHPIKTGIAAAAAQMTEDERAIFGLDPRQEDALPEYRQGSIPIEQDIKIGPVEFKAGEFFTPQSLTTFGVFADYPANMARFILPQFPLDELRGIDFAGRTIRDDEGKPIQGERKVFEALKALGEAYIPGLMVYQRLEREDFDASKALIPKGIQGTEVIGAPSFSGGGEAQPQSTQPGSPLDLSQQQSGAGAPAPAPTAPSGAPSPLELSRQQQGLAP